MKKHIVAFAIPALVVLLGCYRQDVRTDIFQVPQMAGAECARIIQDALAPIEGIQSAQPDYENRTIAVTYDTKKLARKNVEYTITGVGFDCNESTANQTAKNKLPDTCK